MDTTAPTAKIDSGPSGTVYSGSASFGFSSEPGATFECSLDGGGFAGCASPKQYNGLPVGEHTFEVRAKDVAGNIGAAAGRAWTIGTPAAKVVGVSPGASATDVPSSTNVTATFSGQISAGALNNATFTLSPVSTAKNPKGSASTVVGSPVSGQVSYDAATNTAKLDPSKPLALNAIYQARIDGAAVGLTGGDRIWRFTTGSGGDEVVSVTPTYDATGVSATTDVAATFSRNMKASSFVPPGAKGDPTFYVLDAMTGEHIAGSVTYDTATKTATLNPAGMLLAHTIYEARIDGAAIGLAGGERTRRFHVDGSSEVVSVTPAHGATGMAASANITATFSAAMDAGSLTDSTFQLVDLMNGKHHVGKVTYDAATKTATYDPEAPLLPGHEYEVTLVPGSKASKSPGVMDAEGYPLSAAITWRFTVEIADP